MYLFIFVLFKNINVNVVIIVNISSAIGSVDVLGFFDCFTLLTNVILLFVFVFELYILVCLLLIYVL